MHSLEMLLHPLFNLKGHSSKCLIWCGQWLYVEASKMCFKMTFQHQLGRQKNKSVLEDLGLQIVLNKIKRLKYADHAVRETLANGAAG